MPYTTFRELTASAFRTMRNGSGSKQELGCLYYFEDLRQVLDQSGIVGIEQVDVLFERNDAWNRGRHSITVIAAVKDASATDSCTLDSQGRIIDNDRYLPKVALPWAPYYIQRQHGGTIDFPGAPDSQYVPGQILTRQ